MHEFKKIDYVNTGEKTTVCCLVDGDYEVVGVFTCKPAMVENFEFRKERAYQNALKIWERGKQIRATKQELK